VPEDLLRSRRWALRADPRSAVRTAVVWELLDTLLLERREAVGRDLDVVDLGGGTGGFAVPIAGLGHRVTVVDPSPDALAALQRRASEAGVAERVHAVQGDAADLAGIIPPAGADLVLCHGVLEFVDDPRAAALAAFGRLRPGGFLSLLVAQRLGAVLARALAGRFADAQRLLTDPDGRSGEADPLPRRFDEASIVELFGQQAPRIRDVHGVRLVTDLLPGALVDGDPAAAEALLELERAAAADPRLAALAAHLHVVLQAT
jgi:SAM-dependent methyltransferase